jgi:D-apiose dehydrogenase
MMSEIIKIGVIGCGGISKWHLKAWEEIRGAEVVALCDINRDNLNQRAKEFGINKLYTDAHDLFAGEKIDAVDIIAPPKAHLELIKEAANRNLHVICQKALATSYNEGLEIANIVDRKKILLMVNENWRWSRYYRKIKEILTKGRIGMTKFTNIQYYGQGTVTFDTPGDPQLLKERPYFKNWNHLIIYEFMIHFLDISRFLFGEPRDIYAKIGRVSNLIKGEDFATIILNYDDMYSIINSNWGARKPEYKSERVDIIGTSGSIYLEDEVIRIVETNKEYVINDYGVEDIYLDRFISAQEHFIKGILEGKNMETGLRDNLKTLKLVFDAYKSAECNTVIKI